MDCYVDILAGEHFYAIEKSTSSGYSQWSALSGPKRLLLQSEAHKLQLSNQLPVKRM